MHKETWGDSRSQSSDDMEQQSSPFMRSFQTHLAHAHNTVIRKVTPCPTLSFYVRVHHESLILGLLMFFQALVSRALVLFVRYSSLIRPMGENGKLRLAGDMAQLELSLAPLMPQGLHDVGAAYKHLRSFRPFIFQDMESAVQSLVTNYYFSRELY